MLPALLIQMRSLYSDSEFAIFVDIWENLGCSSGEKYIHSCTWLAKPSACQVYFPGSLKNGLATVGWAMKKKKKV